MSERVRVFNEDDWTHSPFAELASEVSRIIWKYTLDFMIKNESPETISYNAFVWSTFYSSISDLLSKQYINSEVSASFRDTLVFLYKLDPNEHAPMIGTAVGVKDSMIKEMAKYDVTTGDRDAISEILGNARFVQESESPFDMLMYGVPDSQIDYFSARIPEIRSEVKNCLEAMREKRALSEFQKQVPSFRVSDNVQHNSNSKSQESSSGIWWALAVLAILIIWVMLSQ